MFFIIALIVGLIGIVAIAIGTLVSKCVNKERSPPAIEEDGIVIAEQPDVESGIIPQSQSHSFSQGFDDAPVKGE